ncbi:hypothetical protein DSECCO2_587240 [anaerobic digester metagenome]
MQPPVDAGPGHARKGGAKHGRVHVAQFGRNIGPVRCDGPPAGQPGAAETEDRLAPLGPAGPPGHVEGGFELHPFSQDGALHGVDAKPGRGWRKEPLGLDVGLGRGAAQAQVERQPLACAPQRAYDPIGRERALGHRVEGDPDVRSAQRVRPDRFALDRRPADVQAHETEALAAAIDTDMLGVLAPGQFGPGGNAPPQVLTQNPPRDAEVLARNVHGSGEKQRGRVEIS